MGCKAEHSAVPAVHSRTLADALLPDQWKECHAHGNAKQCTMLCLLSIHAPLLTHTCQSNARNVILLAFLDCTLADPGSTWECKAEHSDTLAVHSRTLADPHLPEQCKACHTASLP
ncbi:hypothetical protein DUNSADRAFT_13672 [Dunaliella salina]|uniref:Uncharacterized protein n=1 Tax=Dunaliella salina TaxID=3046 RepID=A0ABQ7G8W5_DUNSA|nr:hypothetical protein DUNSADRAFT_13672 [Dunaliella salina]|eukprot:KAF5831041.1 hypothetical protein DUNSADRAFT_13672 [Dunaliella salina]